LPNLLIYGDNPSQNGSIAEQLCQQIGIESVFYLDGKKADMWDANITHALTQNNEKHALIVSNIPSLFAIVPHFGQMSVAAQLVTLVPSARVMMIALSGIAERSDLDTSILRRIRHTFAAQQAQPSN
jgi:hypothetical protein